jgi:hypothetical protein
MTRRRIIILSIAAGVLATIAIVVVGRWTSRSGPGARATTNPPKAGGYYSTDGTGNAGTWKPYSGTGTPYSGSTPASYGFMVSTDGTGNPGTWVAATSGTFGNSSLTGTANTWSSTQTYTAVGQNNPAIIANGIATDYGSAGATNVPADAQSQSGYYSRLLLPNISAAGATDCIGLSNVNGGSINHSANWICAVYNTNYSSYLQFNAARVGNTAYADKDADRGLILANNNTSVDATFYGNVSAFNGTNVVYRCATAGALPAGALTITAGSCGTTADTGLRVK